MHRKTLSKLVKISELRLIDRKTLASVIRNEKSKYGQLKESLGYVGGASTIGSKTNRLHSEQPLGGSSYDLDDYGDNTMNYGDNTINYGDNTNEDSDGLLCGDYGDNAEDEGDNTNIGNVEFEDPTHLYSYDLGDKESTTKYDGDKDGGSESAFVCATETGSLGELMEGNTVREICRKYNIPMSDVGIV